MKLVDGKITEAFREIENYTNWYFNDSKEPVYMVPIKTSDEIFEIWDTVSETLKAEMKDEASKQ